MLIFLKETMLKIGPKKAKPTVERPEKSQI